MWRRKLCLPCKPCSLWACTTSPRCVYVSHHHTHMSHHHTKPCKPCRPWACTTSPRCVYVSHHHTHMSHHHACPANPAVFGRARPRQGVCMCMCTRVCMRVGGRSACARTHICHIIIHICHIIILIPCSV